MATVRVGGHITLLFSIHDDAILPRNQGSRGAGMCLEKGVVATIDPIGQAEPEEQGQEMAGWQRDVIEIKGKGRTEVNISSHGEPFDGQTQMYVDLIDELRNARLLPEDVHYALTIELELPVSQGFGMSAAGLCATALACFEMTNQGSIDQYFRISHHIERRYRGGLGDVLGLYVGGVELRTIPGSPPSPGHARSFGVQTPVLLIWKPEGSRHTSEYIDHLDWKKTITKAGDEAVNTLSDMKWDETIWSKLLQESQTFATASKMLEEPTRRDLLESVRSIIQSHQLQASIRIRLCMLGTSCVLLPTRLNEPLSEETLNMLASELQQLGFGAEQTSLSPSRMNHE
jgi:pantoate kinase